MTVTALTASFSKKYDPINIFSWKTRMNTCCYWYVTRMYRTSRLKFIHKILKGLYTLVYIFGLIFELLGNISKRWEHFTNLLNCRKFFPWKAEIIPQKRKFAHFFWIFFHLNYEIYLYFLINWIFLRPKM